MLAAVSVAANPWEEVGWRAFALSRLLARYPVPFAGLLVGVLAALWHLPLVLWPASPMSHIPLWLWFAETTAKSCVLAWLYVRCGQSLAIAILFHLAVNVTGGMVGVKSNWVLGGIIAVTAIVLLGFVKD